MVLLNYEPSLGKIFTVYSNEQLNEFYAGTAKPKGDAALCTQGERNAYRCDGKYDGGDRNSLGWWPARLVNPTNRTITVAIRLKSSLVYAAGCYTYREHLWHGGQVDWTECEESVVSIPAH